MSFSATNLAQPLQLNTATPRSNDKPSLLLPKTSSFLGSTPNLRPTSPSANHSQSNAHRRSAVVAVSEAVKEKKLHGSTNL
ncbi:hypothetical protein ACE6H2_008085 [Prunus campanulata]